MTASLSRGDQFTIILVSLIIVIAALAFWPLLDVIILSASLSVVMLPLHRNLCKKVNESLAAALTTAFVFFFILSTFLFTINIVYQNREYIAELVALIIEWIRTFQLTIMASSIPIPPEQVADWVSEQISGLGNYISTIITEVPGLIIEIIIFFLSMYLFIHYGEEVWNEFVRYLPGRLESAIREMAELTVNTMYAVWVVHVVTAVLTFFLALPFFYFLGYGNVVLLSVIAAIFQLIPIIGPSLIMIFLGIYAISLGDYRGLLLVAVIGYPVVSAFPDLYVRPLLMGRRACIHPVLLWIGYFGGLAVMGLVGFVLGPLFIALVVAGYHILTEELRLAKEENVFE
jgi:predicted PurR-regulated permease PerM